MGRSARNKANIRTRQPLANMLFKAKNEKEKAYISELADQIKEELNIKAVTLVDSIDSYVTYDAKPNFVTLGKKLGKQIPMIAKGLKEMNGAMVAAQVQRGEAVAVAGISLSPDDIQVAVIEKEGVVAVEDKGYVAILDVTISKELEQEGLVRDLVRHIQTLRKEADFNVDDRIEMEIVASEDILKAVETYREYLENETLGTLLENRADSYDASKEIKVGNEGIILNIIRVKNS
jgi:isoleucyl-tRNA synthetase